MDTDLNNLIVEIYQRVRSVSLGAFQKWAFEKLQGVIPFESGLWGCWTEAPRRLSDVFLYNQPRAIVDDYIACAQGLDFIWPMMRKNPGITINSADLKSHHALKNSDFYRGFAHAYGIEGMLGTAIVDPVSSLCSVISFWRGDSMQPFTETERQLKEIITPHLIEANKMNRLFHIEAPVPHGTYATWATAICEPPGILCLTDTRFTAVIRSEWLDWNTGRLPRKLSVYLQSQLSDPFIGRRVIIHAHKFDGLILLKARRKGAVDRLGKKEHQTALYLAEGRTYQEVAELRKASPSTIRNQAHKIYQKLSIMNKAQLAHALARFAE